MDPRSAYLLTALSLALGCRSSPTSTSTSTSAPPANATAPASVQPANSAAPEADAFSCHSAADCTNSCAHGAVNLRWWQRAYPGGEACEDGCASKGSEAPRCENEQCVAYRLGKPSPECTRKRAAVLAGPGPAHRCQADADCRISCRYGAVNENWYSYGAKDECKDGCAQAFETARCEDGACVAYDEGKRDPKCTRRSIHVE